MHFTPFVLLMLVLALPMLWISITRKPRENPLFRVDPVAARASNIVLWGFFSAWPIVVGLGSQLKFAQVAPFVLGVCFSLLLWGWFRARAV
jgi:hypothetical protein